jgi:acyl-CoA reductase-like NAD-dependent aldehyde dehydrogenase
MRSVSVGTLREHEALPYIDGGFEPSVSGWQGALELVNRHRTLMNSVFTGDAMRGLAFARRVNSSEVHVNDGYARHGGEGQQAAFTRRQWIGIQAGPVSYPGWAQARR